MPSPISLDLRQRLIEAYDAGDETYDSVAERFKVGRASVSRWLGRTRRGEPLEAKSLGGHRHHKVGDAERERIKSWLADRPDRTLAELRQLLLDECGCKVSIATVHRSVVLLGLTLKKKSFVAPQRSTERVIEARKSHEEVAKTWNADDLIFLDECGVRIGMRLLYGWSPRGERIRTEGPVHRGENITVIGAISTSGPFSVLAMPGSFDGGAFLAWVEAFLVPFLRPGKIVIMDNLRVHKVAGVREMIEATGAQIVFLPPYSPDLNPIEECWSKLKHWVRRLAASGRDQLLEAVAVAVEKITASDARGWFSHAGYAIST